MADHGCAPSDASFGLLLQLVWASCRVLPLECTCSIIFCASEDQCSQANSGLAPLKVWEYVWAQGFHFATCMKSSMGLINLA